jgi:glycosyltransferase involved in cell wall biosynthesis
VRLAWVTAARPHGEVDAYCRTVVGALSRRAEVDVVDAGLDGAVAERVSGYDHVVYVVGDQTPGQPDLFGLLSAAPGVVILHERSLLEHYEFHLGDRQAFLDRVTEMYGYRARGFASKLVSGRLASERFESPQAVRISFIEDALAGQRGVVVHSRSHALELAEIWPGPVRALELPTPGELLARPPRAPSPDGPLTLLSTGSLNRSRHVHDVIEAIAGDRELAQSVRYLALAGPGSDLGYVGMLEQLVDHHSLSASVEVRAEDSPLLLSRANELADVHVDLRDPMLESGPVSLPAQLATGRPLVVYGDAAHGELPDRVAIKLAPRDPAALARALRRLAASPELRAELGGSARQEAERRTPDRYAASLLEFLEAVSQWPWREFSDRVGSELAALGMGPGMAVHSRVGRELALLLPAHLDWRDRDQPRASPR